MDTQYTDPTIWGPHFWYVFNCIANNYPDTPTPDDMILTKNFYSSMQQLLPCEICKESYTVDFKTLPIDPYLQNKDKLKQWVTSIYELTNKRIQSQKELPKDPSPIGHLPIPKSSTKSCKTCGRRAVPDERSFPQPTPENSGPDMGIIGGLRKVMESSSIPNKYLLLAYYSWIKYPHKLPSIDESKGIIKGYILLKNHSPQGYYPEYLEINNKKVYLIEESASALTNIDTSFLIYNKLKFLSI